MIEERMYKKNNVISFYKTDEKFGLLSNMKGRLILYVNDLFFTSSEAIYQSFRFPNNINLQKIIAKEKSPLIAKRIAKKYVNETREDWEQIKNDLMRISLRIKLLESEEFQQLLKLTIGKEIIEISRKDDYWGVIPIDDNIFRGKNVLGRLLMELREEFIRGLALKKTKYLLKKVNNLKINGKLLSLENLYNNYINIKDKKDNLF